MDSLLNFFDNLEQWQMLLWVFACLGVFALLENLTPLFRFDVSRLRHDTFNVGLFVLNGVIVIPVTLLSAWVITWNENAQWGVLYAVELPVWLELLLAIMVLDFVAQYVVHYLLHHVKWMWRLHIVHHADTHVTASTGTRHHPGDLAMRLIFATFAIVAFGIPLVYYLIYRLLTPFFCYFTHANVRLPEGLDRLLSLVFITPDIHKFHHHYKAPWTDSNFGNIFSFWDRLFGTLVHGKTEDIRYGLDIMDDSRDLDFWYQMKAPLDRSIDTSNSR